MFVNMYVYVCIYVYASFPNYIYYSLCVHLQLYTNVLKLHNSQERALT